jgi:hypothetical protein
MTSTAIRTTARATLGVALMTAATFLQGCFLGDVHLEQETRSVEVAHVAARPIDVTTNNGRVDVAADRTVDKVVIKATVKARTPERLAQAKVTATRDGQGALIVGVEWPGGRPQNNEGCAFDIRLPDASGVRIDTSNGEVRVSGLSGVAELNSSNGGITVTRHDGSVNARTSNGAVEMSDVSGDVGAHSSNGGIHVAGAGGRVSAKTSNGGIRVVLTDSAPGPVRAESSNGDVVLVLGPSFKGRLKLGTDNGSVKMDPAQAGTHVRVVSQKRTSALLAVGPDTEAGSEESTAGTSNGDVEVRFVIQAGTH